MGKVTLSDGREYETVFFGITSAGYMMISVEMDIGEAYNAFSSGTDVITYELEEVPPRRFKGFTKLEYIVNETTCSRVALTRPLLEEDDG